MAMSKTLKYILIVVLVASISIASYYLWTLWCESQTLSKGQSRKLVPITGAGATFPYPQIAQWVNLFKKSKGVDISYQSVGSGAGQRMFLIDKTVDFGCSDPPLSKSQYEEYKGRVMQIPWLMGAVAVVYNVPEIPTGYNLKLTMEVIAKVFKGEIEYWDNQEIKELNQDIADKLPHQPIIVVHRSDSSGTTEVFTTALHKAVPSIWTKELVGKTVDWPVDKLGRGLGGKGNEGVTSLIQQNRYSIGYVEWGYAIEYNLSVAAIRNAAGRFVLPTLESVKAAAKGISIPKSPLEDFSNTLYDVVYSPHSDSYPISSFTFIFLWKEYGDRDRAYTISEFLKWIASEGYKNLVPGYAEPIEEVKNLLIEAANILVSQ